MLTLGLLQTLESFSCRTPPCGLLSRHAEGGSFGELLFQALPLGLGRLEMFV
jgi:hypothetical protein